MHYFILSTFVLHTYGLVSSVCGHWATKQTNTFTKGMIVKLLLLLFFTWNVTDTWSYIKTQSY